MASQITGSLIQEKIEEMVGSDLFKNKYLAALFVFVFFFFLSKFIVFITERYILRITKKTKTDVDDLIIHGTKAPISMLLVFFGLKFALIPLALEESVNKIINELIITFIIIIATYIAIKVFDIIIDNWGKDFAKRTKSEVDDQILSLFHRFSRIVIGVIGLLFILASWGVQIMPLLASLGIAGIAIAFAMQSTLANIFGGISLIVDKNIKKGDVIKLDAETSGAIEDIGLRSTKIKTFDNNIIIVPNGKLAESKIQNLLLPDPSERVTIDFGVAYGSDVDKVKKTVLEVIKKIPKAMKEPEPSVMFIDMGDFALKFKAFFWVADFMERFKTKEEATCKIYNALNRAKINIPYPTSTIYLKKK